ncbi:hypothetical protein V6N12_018508 [Hibiscus sabdariffa]|uniref:Uncharacterized protein n=1 Tax=Hibiscus sabdariffa TaxID=183260 RepID=A0ABR2AQJ1_9ROSI
MSLLSLYLHPFGFGLPATANLADDSEETKTSGLTSQLIPNSFGVESLFRDVCDTTSIAKFESKLGGFRLYIVRDLAGKSEPPPVIASPPPISVSTNKTVEAPESNGAVSTSLAITKPLSSSKRIELFYDEAADEGLAILQSPKCCLKSLQVKERRLIFKSCSDALDSSLLQKRQEIWDEVGKSDGEGKRCFYR